MLTPRTPFRLPLGLAALRALFTGFQAPQSATVSAPATGRWTVGHGRIAWFARAEGLTITCETGTLWITFEGRTTDLVLHAGESHRCGRADMGMVVSAASPAQFVAEATPA